MFKLVNLVFAITTIYDRSVAEISFRNDHAEMTCLETFNVFESYMLKTFHIFRNI